MAESEAGIIITTAGVLRERADKFASERLAKWIQGDREMHDAVVTAMADFAAENAAVQISGLRSGDGAEPGGDGGSITINVGRR